MGGEESEQFTRGVHDDLLTRLSNVSELEVISRTSVMRYATTTSSLPEIAGELGVRWVVEGGVQGVGDQIKVNVQLVDPETDTHVWADQYRRECTAENLFALQGEITRQIAHALETRLTPAEERRVDRRPTEDLEAYRLYAQGRGFLDLRSETGIRKAVELFRRALELDDTYAPVWASLSEAEATYEGYYGSDLAEVVRGPAWEAARKALELDPELAEARASAGLLHLYRQEGPAALHHFQKALELEPSLAQAHRWLGVVLDVLGREDADALFHLRRAIELNPMAPEGDMDLGGALLVRGRYEEALRHVRRAEELEPGFEVARFMEVMILHHMGRHEQARSVHREGEVTRWSPALDRALLAVIDAAAGDPDRARTTLADLEEDGDPLAVAWIRAALGDVDAAFDAIGEVERWGMGEAILFRNAYPAVLQPLKEDPRYERAIRDLDRAWGLRPGGGLPGGA